METLTFLFTDIEGSTRLWEKHPEAMERALARHCEIVGSAVRDFGGRLVRDRGEGDSTFSVFADPLDAVRTICAIQLALHREPWPDEVPIRVRAAAHFGAAYLDRDGRDYNSADVNRCARMRALAAGGQTLLSDALTDAVTARLDPPISLLPLGSHWLKDLSTPESIYQLAHPDLPASFPPLRSLQYLRTNLSHQLTSFVGREREMEHVKALIAESRLVTIVGAGGAGKTRLSLQVGAELLEEFPDGVWVAELAALSSGSFVPQSVANSLGLREEAGRSVIESLIDFLKSKKLLLILDNCEHLTPACAHLADTLLRHCPSLRILATSREPVNINGEQVWRIPSLSIPDPQKEDVDAIVSSESVRLFLDRASKTRPEFSVSRQNLSALASVCRRLDGIPLALELAAARMKSLSIEDLNRRLDRRFQLLTGGSRVALPRHQTLRSLIDWSYDLLDEKEKALLCRLSVFSNGWTIEAAEQVCSGGLVDGSDIMEILTSLVDKSLAVVSQRASASRYWMLDTIRQYANDRLREWDKESEWRERHLKYFISFTEKAGREYSVSSVTEWLSRFDIEHDNLRAALTATNLSHDVRVDQLRIATGLLRFWAVRGFFAEGFELTQNAIDSAGDSIPSDLRTTAILCLGSLAWARWEYEKAEECARTALSLCREMGDQLGQARALMNIANIRWGLGEYDEARDLYRETLELAVSVGDRNFEAAAYNALGFVAFAVSDLEAAKDFHTKALEICRSLSHRLYEAHNLDALGTIEYERKNYADAKKLFEQALGMNREIGYRTHEADNLTGLALVAAATGDSALAREHLSEVIDIYEAVGSDDLASTMEHMARLTADDHDWKRATLYCAYAHRVRETRRYPALPIWRRRTSQVVVECRSGLSEEQFDAAWREGSAISRGDIILLTRTEIVRHDVRRG